MLPVFVPREVIVSEELCLDPRQKKRAIIINSLVSPGAFVYLSFAFSCVCVVCVRSRFPLGDDFAVRVRE